MYQGLIDKVEEIVKKNGKDILKENKFWNILTDEYSFHNDPILKKIFKEILSSSYLSEIFSFPNQKDSIDLIKKYFDNLRKSYPVNEEEIKAVLFSIALAAGKCSIKEYNSFNKKKTPKPGKKWNWNPWKRKRYKPKYFKIWETLLLWIALIIGLVVTLGGTDLYRNYYQGTGMTGVIIMIALLQFPYGGFIWLLNRLNNNQWFKKTLILMVYPFALAALANSFLWIPLLIWRNNISDYLELYGWQEKNNSIFFAIIFGIGLIYCMLGVWANVKPLWNNYTKGYNRILYYDKGFVRGSTYALLGFYILLYVIYPAQTRSHSYNESRGEIESNRKLVEQRIFENKDLSYRGIALGESYSNIFNLVKKKAPEVIHSDCGVKIKGNESVWDVIKNIRNNYEANIKTDTSGDIILQGKDFMFPDSLYIYPINFYVYGFNNRVQLIKLHIKGKKVTDDAFREIKQIYEQKYGTPEVFNTWTINSFGKDKDFEYKKDGHSKEPILIWTFGNGLIYLSKEEIFYLSREFYHLIQDKEKESLKLKEELQRQKTEEIKRQQLERQEKERQQRIQDSLNQIESYKKALKNI